MTEEKKRALQSLTDARLDISSMHRELTGCDWCCGGGDERMDAARAKEAAALKILGDDAPPGLCLICDYYEYEKGSTLCAKCAKTPTEEPA